MRKCVDGWMPKEANPYTLKLIYSYTHIRSKGGAKMEAEVELSRIIINEMSDQQIIVLKERHGDRSFPIVIGIVEIFAIDRRLKGITPPLSLIHISEPTRPY